jgi:putative transposase
MRRAFKFRLYPNVNQTRELDIMLETHRRLYNAALEQRKLVYETRGISLNYYAQANQLKELREADPYQARTNFSSAQATLRRLDKSYQNFFRRCKTSMKEKGFPRFKGRDHFDSVEFPTYGDGIRFKDNRLRVQHVGMIRTKVHRPIEGMVKTVSLKREAEKWFVILSCDLGVVVVPPSTLPPIGIDVGLEAFLTTSDGAPPVENPRYLKAELPKLRRLQRAVSRKKRGGRNRRKASRIVRVLHARVRNLRHEHHHQVALFLIRLYGLIGVERLSVANMLKNHSLARAISDAGWASFVNVLRCKAERAGAEVVAVNPYKTSQICSGCGNDVPKKLTDRWHTCPYCGLSLHRDKNAARNILARTLLARTGPTDLKSNSALVREAVCFS